MTGNPQKENGYTPIANELMEVFSSLLLSPYEWCVLMAILRKLYGWKKHTDIISVSQLTEATNISRRNVQRTLKKLEARRIIETSSTWRGHVIHFNKNYTRWEVASIQIRGSVQTDAGGSVYSDAHKRKLKKDTKEKEIRKWRENFKTSKSM